MHGSVINLVVQLAVSAGMVLLTVTIHGFGLALLSRLVADEQREVRTHHLPPLSVRGTLFTLATVIVLFALHGVEIWAYALLYDALQAQPTFEASLYYSTISYAAIGYNDAGIDPHWRMVGAIEGINGVILLGWSTAFFVNLLGRMRS